ncbi:tetratricopeptide repeat protein [Candidatus Woesearchaeota archaeon]|nr:MAG: tetratricopeptide repeat protein [Candidatus Woesearchaeota archaeon]
MGSWLKGSWWLVFGSVLVLALLSACSRSVEEGGVAKVVVRQVLTVCPSRLGFLDVERCETWVLVDSREARLGFPLGSVNASSLNVSVNESLLANVTKQEPFVLSWNGVSSVFVAPLKREDGERLCSAYGYDSAPLTLPFGFCDLLLYEAFEKQPWKEFPASACGGSVSEECLLRHAERIPDADRKLAMCDTFPDAFQTARLHCFGNYFESLKLRGTFVLREEACKGVVHRQDCFDAYYFYAPACGLIKTGWLSLQCERTYSFTEDKARSFNNECLFLLEDGQLKGALAACNKALDLSEGREGFIWDSKGQVLEALGRLDEARQVYEVALRLDPRLHETRERLDRLQD